MRVAAVFMGILAGFRERSGAASDGIVPALSPFNFLDNSARMRTGEVRGCATTRVEGMETLDGILKFLASYPTWAKALLLGNIACLASVIVFARTPASQPAAPASTLTPVAAEPASARPTIKITGVDLYPGSSDAGIQVSVFVNGTKFTYPSLAGVEWLQVGPAMSGQTFELPKSDSYTLRFEMRKREARDGSVSRFASQETVPLSAKASGHYNLYFVDRMMKRSASVDAQIRYTFDPGK